uniref:Baculoviral IAP repeat-containing protein 6 n=1 Tax=Ascaris suum TaxID=6253 RepID=F1KPF7_ASCSU
MSDVHEISPMPGADAAAQPLKGVDDDRIAISISMEWELPDWLQDACEVFYIESNNTLLFRCKDGSLIVADANFESTVPLATAAYSPKAQVLYDKQNGTIIFLDERSLCFRREYSSVFLIKEALTVQDKTTIRLEIPAEEAAKLIQAAASEETIVLRRPALAAFIAKLSSLLTSVQNASHETIVVEFDGAELLSELRPTEGVTEGQPEVPMEWTSPIWPHVAALAERIRLLLNPEHPYNFEYTPEWKGIDKEVMVSEAARKLTFEHWPHMNYRWALPCQMAEAGFFHQPNKAGDDRVLCFACLVCLVCWEPSDEPWSEHERHSQSCRFIRNNANPNVPLAVTMSALSPFPHHIQPRSPSKFVIATTSNCEWIAIATEASSRVHLWRCDRVVHASQFFTIDVADSFIAMKTGYALTEVPRRGPRVTWSDEAVDTTSTQSSSTTSVLTTPSEHSLRAPSNSSSSTSGVNMDTQSFASSSTGVVNADEMLITAMCTVGNPCMIEQSPLGAGAGSSPTRCHPTIVIGIALDNSKLSRTDRQHGGSAEVCALNSVNSVCGADATPRIVLEDGSGPAEQARAPTYHPFIVVYQIAENGVVYADSGIAGGRSDDTKDEETWCVQPSSGWISALSNDKSPPTSEGAKMSKSGDSTYMSKMTSLTETDFAEAMMLVESENEAPEWSTNTGESDYEHPGDQPMLEDEWATELKGATKFEDKPSGDFIAVNYEPSPVGVVLLQCFRLPPELDESSMKVKAIVPTVNGMNLIVAVSHDSDSSGPAQSAILVYRLIFTHYVTSVEERPFLACFNIQHAIEQMLVVSADAFASPANGTNSEQNGPVEDVENVVIRTSEGEVWLIDVNKNERVKMCEEKVKYITLMDSSKCALLTEADKLLVVQVEQTCSRRAAEEEDEEATVAALLGDMHTSQTASTGISTSSASASATADECSSIDNTSHISSRTQIYAMQSLTCGNLRKLWELTRSDGGSSLLSTPSTSVAHGGVPGFQVVPPLGWSEIQLHQKFRKNPQHWLRGDRSTRSWHLQPDVHGLPNMQAFEMHLQMGMQISHANVRFTFHSLCVGCPSVQITVLRRRIVAQPEGSKDVHIKTISGARPSVFKVDIDEVRNQCDVMAGPLLLADYIDVGGTSSIVQLPGRTFSSASNRTHVGSKAVKVQTFYLVLESLSDMSFEQLVAAHKNRDKEKTSTQDTSSKMRSWRRRDLLSSEKKSSEQKSRKTISKGNSDLSQTSLQLRKGIEWIEEISITLLKAKRGPERHERIQRRMMIETYEFHARLVKLAAGVSRRHGGPQQVTTNGVRLLKEHRALDLIIWLLDNWSVSSSVHYIVGVSSVIADEIDNLIVNGFVYAPRSIAHKWCSLIIHLLYLLKALDSERYYELLEALMKSLTSTVERLYLVENAGALHWLLTLTFAALQMCTSLAGRPKCSQMVDDLLTACANTITSIGEAWNKSWNESVHEKLASKYGLCGLPLELVMYEWPSPMLSLWSRSGTTNNCLVPMGTSVTVMPMPIAVNAGSGVKYPWSSPALSTSHLTPKQVSGSAAISGSSLTKTATVTSAKEAVAVSAFLNSVTAQDEIDWLDVFNMVLGETNDGFNNAASTTTDSSATNSIVPPPGTGYALNSRFGSNASEPSAGRDVKKRVFLSPSQLSGLLEVEPLTFACCAASEHVKVENLDTGTITTISSSNTPVVHVASKGPVVMKTANAADLSQTATSVTLTSETDLDTFLKANLQSLSARMKKIAMEVNDQCAKDQNSSTETGMHTACTDAAQGSTTQGSSASTFGVPTTPKTTPFMTPTPLSPSHLSPINSETNLTILPEEDRIDETRSEELSGENLLCESTRAAKTVLTPAITVVPCDLLKPPPIQVLSIERMAAGARKFVVLDFGVPVLLTDILIPSCTELSSLFVDVWLLGESVDGQRLIASAQIASKSIALQDIAPTMLIRFVKLTYVGRQLFNAPCRVPIGSFFGHRFFSAWQPYACPHMIGQLASYPTLPHPYQQAPPVSIEHLRQLCEDLRCRHQLASNELVNLVEEDADERDVKKVYKECTLLRAQWNVVHGVVRRLTSHQALVRDFHVMEGSWESCGAEQLRVVAEQLFGLLTQSVHLLDLRSAAAYCTTMAVDPDSAPSLMELSDVSPTVEEVSAHHLLSLDMAVRHFTLFCTTALPKLQVDCAIWLFHHGAEMPWWPSFFPRVLVELFSSPMQKCDEKVFLLLSFLCNHTVKSASSQASVMLELLQFIDGILKRSLAEERKNKDNDERPTLQMGLLCCAILLTSTAFDVILGGKRKLDRWAFAAGEFAFGVAHATSPSVSTERLGDYSRIATKKSSPLGTVRLSNVTDVDVGAPSPTAAELHSKVQSLWGQHLQHLQTMEAMKASIKGMSKTVKAVDDKLQKKSETKPLKSSFFDKTPSESLTSSSVTQEDQTFTTKFASGSKSSRFPKMTVRQVQDHFEKKLEELNAKLTPDFTSGKIEELIKWAGKSSSLSPLKPRSNRPRQYNIRLRLPLEICESVASGLIRTLCEHTEEIPSGGKLLLCKMVSRICTNASHHTIPLVAVIGDHLDQLIQIGLNSRNAVVMRSAVLSLLEDVIEAEARGYAKIAASSVMEGSTSVPPSIYEGIAASDVEEFCRKLTGIEYTKLAEQALQRSTTMKNVGDKKSTGAAAAASAMPFAFAFMKTSHEFSIANYDTAPTQDGELDTLIEQAMSLIGPVELSACTVGMSPRSTILRYLCREVITSRLEKGEHFSNVFRWIDGVRYGEARVASAADNVVAYAVKLCSPSLPRDAFPVSEDKQKASISALIACLRNEQNIYNKAMKVQVEQMEPPMATMTTVVTAVATGSCGSSSPSVSTSPTIQGGEEENIDELVTNSEVVDADELQTMKALDTFADNMSGNITKDAAAVLVSCDRQEDTLIQADDRAISSLSAPVIASDEKWKSEGSSRGELLLSLPKEKANKQMLLDHIMISFLMQARTISEEVMVQPCSVNVDERAECQLGLRAYIQCLSVDSLADILLRHSRRHLAPWRKRAVSRPRAPESESMRLLMGRTLQLATAAISELIKKIPVDASVEYVSALLSFYNDFYEGITFPEVVRRMISEMHLVFPEEGIDAVLAFAAACERPTEQLWTLIIRFLFGIIRSDDAAGNHLILSPMFFLVISRLITKSVSRFSESTTVGPAMTSAFGDLVHRLHATSVKETFAVVLMTIISDIFLKTEGFEFLPYPVEMIMQVVRAMRRQPEIYAHLPSETLSRFIWAVIRVTKELLHSDKFVRNEPVSALDANNRADLCFQSVKMMDSEDEVTFEKDDKNNDAAGDQVEDANSDTESFKPYWSVSQLPFARLNAYESSSQLRFYEEMVGTLLQEVLGYCMGNKTLVANVIRTHPGAVEDLLEVLSSCSFYDRDYDSLFEERRFLNCWKPVSVADYALRLFLLFSDLAGDQLEHLVGLTVECLKHCVTAYAPPGMPKLTKPVAFAVVYMLLMPQNQRVFIDFGGHLIVSSEIKNCIATSMGDWTVPEGGAVVRQLASMATQVAAGEYAIAPRRPPDIKVEGLFNYAPICSIASSSSMAHQLSTLLAAAPPHRRARTANWSYHFYPSEEWLDLTLTLPYQIMLYEVHIRPHPPTLNTGPSAVQLEVCSDPTFSTWTLLAPKMCTLGFSKIRIPTQSFPYPVSAIRIYLRRAPDSTNLGLSQILVLGTSSLQALAVPPSVSCDFRQWLAILDRLCTVEETSIWQYARDLPRCIVALFLGRPLQTGIYRRVCSLFVRIDNPKAKPHTIVQLILNYIAQGRYVAPKSLDWLPEVIFTLCSKAAEGTRTPVHVKHQLQVFRQRQLLTGITSILSSTLLFPYNQQEAVAVLMWSASCAIWNNISDEGMHHDTVAVCVEIGTKLIPRLCDVASNVGSKWRTSMCEAASWLLCSLIRCAPTHLPHALRFLGFSGERENDYSTGEIPSLEAMTVVGRMCQSATAVRSLLSTSTLQHWTELAITLCEGGDAMRLVALAGIVECLRALCSIEEVVDYLDSPRGSALFKPLITFVAHLATTKMIPSSNTTRRINLENATVGLICKCISVGRGHRERISNILCSLLKNERTLNGAVQQMVLKCVLDDETITVKLIDEKAPSFFLAFNFKSRMVHPLFGCSRREHVSTVSIYSAFREVLHPCVLPANAASRSTSKRNVDAVAQERTAAAVDAQSKGLIVTYLMCDAYSKRRPVNGDWYVGQFIDAVRSAQPFSRSSIITQSAVDRDTREDAISRQEENATTLGNFIDGYFTLMLKVNTSTIEELKRAVEDELPPFEVPSTTAQHISTLQHFARAGGLAILAQHLQLYQPSSTINTTTVSSRGPVCPKESVLGGWLQNYVMQPLMAEPNGYIPVYFPMPDATEEGPTSSMTGFGVAVPSSFADDSSLSYDHDFEFIDMPQSNMSFDFVQKFYPPFASHPSHAAMMPNVQKGPSSRVPASSSYSLSTALSPHVVIAFSVLLRLDGYAELLVTYDRIRSKRLLRLAMGVSTFEQGTSSRSVTPLTSTRGAFDDVSSDNDTLALLPFIVLERLFRTQHPDTASGRSLRTAAVKYGVLDILLVCLAHYSHQHHKVEPIRPESLLPAPESVKLTEHLLRASAQMEALRAEAANNANANGYDDRTSTTYGGTVTSTAQTQQQNFWAKGTGFGSGTTQQQWNVDAHVMKRKLDEETVTHLLRVLASYIFPRPTWRRGRYSRSRRSTATSESSAVDGPSPSFGSSSPLPVGRPPSRSVSLSSPTAEVLCDEWSLDASIVELLARSCLLPTICAYLRNDSVLDISRHVEVYEAVVYLVAALARCPSQKNDQGEDALAALLCQCDTGVSLLTMLKKLHGYILAYLSKLYTENVPKQSESNTNKKVDESVTASADGTTSKGSEEGLMRLSHIIMRTSTFVSTRVGSDNAKTENNTKTALTTDERYIEAMRGLQFQSISFFSDTARIPYHYESSLSAVCLTASLGKRTRRLAQEVVTLSNSLPLTASSSVFVRCAEERLDVMKVLITGPSDTPYMNGCFEFDVWFPADYPNSPMHVNLETTGNHTVRFNPNLYNDGKVCLSVLNTWHGRPEERWNPETSSFLQVIVSMQSLILVSEPYFNEPGYERSKCTQAGQQASRDYDANIRQATVRWAMLEMIRHPPVAFRDVIMSHFWLKRYEIISQITEWIKETESQIEEQRGAARTLQAHLASLKRHFAALNEEFSRMQRPASLEDDGEQVAPPTPMSTADASGVDAGPAVRQLPVQPTRLATMKVLKL